MNHSQLAYKRRLIRFWQDMPLVGQGVVLNAIPLTVLLASLAFIFNSEQQTTMLESRLEAALQVQKNIQEVHSELLEASTGVRDYLLTDDQAFLLGYNEAKQRIPPLLETLARMLDDSEQQALLNDIRPLIDTNIQGLGKLFNKKLDHANQTVLIHAFNQQSQALNQLRELLKQMSVNEAKLIAQDRIEVATERQHNRRITMIAVISGVLGSLIGVWIFSKTIVSRVRTIRDSAAHLAKGEPLALPAISRDELGQLTEELDHAAQLLAKSAQDAHQARVEAEQASAAKSMFLSRTSHELRTPLNAILGFAHILESDLEDSTQKDNAVIIQHAAQHLLKLINEVLDIARIESGDITLSLTQFKLNDLLEQAVRYINPLAKTRNIDIKTNFVPTLQVYADAQKLLQVVLNLLSNAIKYGPHDATVYFNSYMQNSEPPYHSPQSQSLIVEVLDQGTGITPSLRARLFTPFDRLGAEQTFTEGSGLGLSLSKQLIEAMGGDIGVDEHRARFWIRLPILPMANHSIQHRHKKPQPDTGNPTDNVYIHKPTLQKHQGLLASQQIKILYIEDKASNRALMEAVIQRQAKYQLHTVSHIQEAHTWLEQAQADVFIIDLNLPDGSGISLIEYLKVQPVYQHIPIIVLSADAMPETITQVKQLEVSAYFTKPLDIAAFNQHLQRITTHEPRKN